MIAAAALLLSGVGAFALETCTPVETAPGIKAVPAGCNKFGQAANASKSAAKIAAKPAPTAKPSVLFPGAAPGSITRFDDVEVRVGGQVRFEMGAGR